MKNFLCFLVFNLFLIFSRLFPQTINLGVKAEPFNLFSKIGTENEARFYVTSLYGFGGLQINSAFQFESQIGFLLSEGYRYNGFEICLVGKYFLRERKEYILGGYILHKNGGDNGHSLRTIGKKISLITIGVGKYLSNIFFIEASYQFPLGDSEYAYRLFWEIQNGFYRRESIKLVGLFKLGIGISFDL